MKPITILTIQSIKNTKQKKCMGKDFYPHLQDMNENYIKENLGVQDD